LTFFELTNKSVKEVKRVFEWALENAEIKQSAMITAKDEYGIQHLGPNVDLEYDDVSELINEETVKTFDMELKDTPYGKRLIITIDVYRDGNRYMMYIGLEEKFFDELERQDVLRKVRSYGELAIMSLEDIHKS
jgi:hypothetical protein